MRLLDLFCGELGWSLPFIAEGWRVTAVDLKRPKHIPEGMMFFQTNVLDWTAEDCQMYDFICASPPCEQFSVHCMKFTKKKDHPFPVLGIKLFEHTRAICAGVPHIIENVRCAQQFVGPAVAHAGSFYLWGSAVPPLLPKGLIKMGNQGGWRRGNGTFRERTKGCRQPAHKSAMIPPELAKCVADYAGRVALNRLGTREVSPAEEKL